MKPSIHKRLYTVLPRPPSVAAASAASTSQLPLPRVRSNSASSPRTLYTAPHLAFFDAQGPPPPPTTRGGHSNVIIGTRVAAEVRAEVEGHTTHPQHPSGHLPYPLALTLGQSESSPHLPLSPYNPFLSYQALSPLFVASAKTAESAAPETRRRRQRARYHLDVGAYGIPKRSRGHCIAGRDGHGRFDVRPELHPDELARAVQVGEDAYFVRDNAMGVADGVGGWSKHRRAGERDASSPICFLAVSMGPGADGVASLPRNLANSAEPTPSALFARRLMHFCSEEVDAASEQPAERYAPAPRFAPRLCRAHMSSRFSLVDLESYSEEDDICAELEDSLEELEDGLDVLMILEKAYAKALQSHVCRPDQASSSGSSRSPSPSDSYPERAAVASSPASSPLSSSTSSSTGAVPLFEGSSTALVAILEHPSSRPAKETSLFNPQPVSSKPGQPEVSTDGAVIRIAHLGDCMGMLIRGEEIVWRTEEMWWNVSALRILPPPAPVPD